MLNRGCSLVRSMAGLACGLALASVLGTSCLANDLQQRRVVLGELKRSEVTGYAPQFPFVSHFSVRDEDGLFLRSTGEPAFFAPSQARSAYDALVVHDLRDFYTARHTRAAFIINQHLGRSGFLLSMGYDSGSKSDKFEVARSRYLGLAKSVRLAQGSFLYLSAGRWLGGSVKESPCLDAYDRAYWCPNLTAWQDRPALANRKEGHVDVVWQLSF